MVDIKIMDDKFVIKGSFDMGYAGLYENKDYSDKKIEIMHDVSEVLENWDIIKEKIDVSKASNEAIEKCLTDYFNEFEKKIQRNIKQVNDNFLINIFYDLLDIGYPFWKHEEIFIRNNIPEVLEEEDLNNLIYKPNCDKIYALSKEFYGVPNDGRKKKPDVESAIRKMFPMFNLDEYLEWIVPIVMCFNDGIVLFQCDDIMDCSLSATCDELDDELIFTGWHNC